MSEKHVTSPLLERRRSHLAGVVAVLLAASGFAAAFIRAVSDVVVLVRTGGPL